MSKLPHITRLTSIHDDSIYEWDHKKYPYALSANIYEFFDSELPDYLKDITKEYIFMGMGMYYHGAVCKEDIDYVDDYVRSQGYEEISESEYESLKDIYTLISKESLGGRYYRIREIIKSKKGVKIYLTRKEAEHAIEQNDNQYVLVRIVFPYNSCRIYKKEIDNKIDYRVFDDISGECARVQVPTRKNKKYWQRLCLLTKEQIKEIIK